MRGPYNILEVPVNATLAGINHAYGTKMLRTDPDPDDPTSPEHTMIQELYDAKEILADKTMREMLDSCIVHHTNQAASSLRAHGLLRIEANASEKEIREAHHRLRITWSGYEKLGAVVLTLIDGAASKMLQDLRVKQKQQDQRQDSVLPNAPR